MTELERYKKALEEILELNGKTLLAYCCVDKSCTPMYEDGEKVAHCAQQYGVFRGYATAASIAEEALAQKK